MTTQITHRGALWPLFDSVGMLMQMSANDSTNLVDSIAASRLGDHVMLLFDEATGQEQRFRPFNNDSLDVLTAWSKQES